MTKIEKLLAEFLPTLRQLHGLSALVVKIEGFFSRPAEIVLVLLPIVSNLGRSLQYTTKHSEIVDTTDIDTSGAHRFVHRHLLSCTFDMIVHAFRLHLSQQSIADKAAWQLQIVHQPWRRRDCAEQINVSDDRYFQVVLAHILEQLQRLPPVPANLRNEEFRTAGNLLLHLVVLLDLRAGCVLEGRNGGTDKKLMYVIQRLWSRLRVRLMIEPIDQIEQSDGIQLEHALGIDGLVACQGKNRVYTCGLEPH